MRRPRRNPALVVALYVNAALLLAILAAVVSGGGGRVPSVLPAAFAQAPQPIAGGAGGVYLMPAQFGPSVWGCYVMDVEAETLCAYEYRPTTGKLKLVTARGIRHDRKLQRFNIDTPGPEEVANLVEMEQNARGGNDGRRPAEPDPEAEGEDGQ